MPTTDSRQTVMSLLLGGVLLLTLAVGWNTYELRQRRLVDQAALAAVDSVYAELQKALSPPERP